MANPLSWHKRVPLLVVFIGCVLPLLLAEQRGSAPVSGLRTHERQPQFQDWSTRHALYSRFGTMAALEAARRDPRAQFRWRDQERQTQARFGAFDIPQRSLFVFDMRGGHFRSPPGRFPLRNSPNIHIDWSINLGANGTAPAMYPAKFSFDTTAAPSCNNDFVVFPVNSDGGASQPNIVAFNQLYSGTIPAVGICNRTTTANDNGASAQVMWSYDIEGIATGAVPTSPVLSLDGKKVAFIESAASAAHFDVLAWKSGDGIATNKQNVLVPKPITTFSGTAPAAGSGTVSDLNFGSAADTLSSPYVDYARDFAYVGNDAGILFRFKNVFCTTASCGTAAPALDTTWGGGTGSVTVCNGKLTGPVQDVSTDNILVGCADGKLYSISQTGVIKSLVVGDGVASKAFGGIVDSPVVDSSNGFVYAVSGSASNGTIGVLVQAKLDFSSSVAVPIGNGNQCNLHAPTVNNAYFTSPTSANALIYIGGVTGTVGTCTPFGATGGTNQLYGATFGAGGVLNSGAPTHSTASANGVGNEYAPLTEFFNTNTAKDYIFVSVLRTTGTVNNMYSFNSTNGWVAAPLHNAVTGLGTSGIVVDNVSASSQASSFYVNALNQNSTCTSPQTGINSNGCATKLTQDTFQ